MQSETKNQDDAGAHPQIVDRQTWLNDRKELLALEKATTREIDKLNAKRRRLPMVKLDKTYVLEGSKGMTSLVDVFEGQKQLIIYHFMFDPKWEEGCPGCTGFVDALGDLSTLGERNTTFALVSRAPFAKLEAYKEKHGWKVPWYSSFDSDFNYDFNVTHDEKIAPLEYNYKNKQQLLDRRGSLSEIEGEDHGLSVFFRIGNEVYHSYSTYARGVESLVHTYALLDVTPYGRQEDWEDSPEGWPQKPTYD